LKLKIGLNERAIVKRKTGGWSGRWYMTRESSVVIKGDRIPCREYRADKYQ
jgi:hypothetical protein